MVGMQGVLVTLLLVLSPAHGMAEPAAEGRRAYDRLCAKCHGAIAEQRLGRHDAGRLVLVVAPPTGPNLTGIFGRPAGKVDGFRYSNAFRKATVGLVWDRASLDRWLADSHGTIRGSYMFMKVPEPARGHIIDYLETYSRYRD